MYLICVEIWHYAFLKASAPQARLRAFRDTATLRNETASLCNGFERVLCHPLSQDTLPVCIMHARCIPHLEPSFVYCSGTLFVSI